VFAKYPSHLNLLNVIMIILLAVLVNWCK
jgi:hypothetical protein